MHIITDPTTISGEAFEVRSLCVHSVIWATNPYPLNASMHCAHSQRLETQNPEALSPTTYSDTGLRSIDAKLPWNHSRWQPLIQRRTTDLWLQTPPFTPSLQTTFCCPQLKCNARPYKHTFSLPDAHFLFYMPISLRLRPLRFSSFLDITLHNNCIKRSHNCSTKSLAQRRDSTTSQTTTRIKQKKTKIDYSECCLSLPILSIKSPPPPSKSSYRFFFSFLHKLPMHRYKLPMHRYKLHVPKNHKPAAFIKSIFRRV